MNTKENIINRMYKHAMSYLGVKKIENLDPLIKLLLEGLASELFSIAREMEDSNRRMMDKIAQLLIPDSSISHTPSHGVVHIHPRRCGYTVTKETGLSCESSNKRNSDSITFYPVKDMPIYDGDVCRILHKGDIYDISDTMTKNHIAHGCLPEMDSMERILWIGVELSPSPKPDKADSLTFFFNLPFRNDRQRLYSLLAYSQWSIDGTPLTCTPNLLKNNGPHTIFDVYHTETTIEKDILACYANQFYSVEWKLPPDEMERRLLPADLERYYPEELQQEQKQKLYWFKLELPLQFDTDAIEELEIYINAVIVENKYLNTSTADAGNPTEIVPLKMKPNHYFLSVADVTDALDRTYRNIPQITEEKQDEGIYSIRHGGCERLNSSELKELLYRQMDLIYDHSALVSTPDKNMFFTQMSRLNEIFGAIDKNFANIDSTISPHFYLIVDTLRKADILYVSYWSTLCEAANQISTGTPLTLLTDTGMSGKIQFLTTTRGGKSRRKTNGNLTTYQYLLTTRDRIFTEYDIINYCRKELAGILVSVEVKKGFIKSAYPREGLVRSLDIYLDTQEKIEGSVLEDLKSKLIVRSPSSFHYRIFLSGKQVVKDGE